MPSLQTRRQLLLSLLSAGTARGIGAKTPGEVDISGVLRDVRMQGLGSASKKLSDYHGKPLLINVWASWCGPCRQEIGSLERLFRKYGGRQFNVIGISTDDYEDRANSFLKTFKISFPNYLDKSLVLENMLGADHLPLTVLVDARGMVLDKHFGAREWDSPASLTLIGKTFQAAL